MDFYHPQPVPLPTAPSQAFTLSQGLPTDNLDLRRSHYLPDTPARRPLDRRPSIKIGGSSQRNLEEHISQHNHVGLTSPNHRHIVARADGRPRVENRPVSLSQYRRYAFPASTGEGTAYPAVLQIEDPLSTIELECIMKVHEQERTRRVGTLENDVCDLKDQVNQLSNQVSELWRIYTGNEKARNGIPQRFREGTPDGTVQGVYEGREIPNAGNTKYKNNFPETSSGGDTLHTSAREFPQTRDLPRMRPHMSEDQLDHEVLLNAMYQSGANNQLMQNTCETTQPQVPGTPPGQTRKVNEDRIDSGTHDVRIKFPNMADAPSPPELIATADAERSSNSSNTSETPMTPSRHDHGVGQPSDNPPITIGVPNSPHPLVSETAEAGHEPRMAIVPRVPNHPYEDPPPRDFQRLFGWPYLCGRCSSFHRTEYQCPFSRRSRDNLKPRERKILEREIGTDVPYMQPLPPRPTPSGYWCCGCRRHHTSMAQCPRNNRYLRRQAFSEPMNAAHD